jgi:hypothetical protein
MIYYRVQSAVVEARERDLQERISRPRPERPAREPRRRPRLVVGLRARSEMSSRGLAGR